MVFSYYMIKDENSLARYALYVRNSFCTSVSIKQAMLVTQMLFNMKWQAKEFRPFVN